MLIRNEAAYLRPYDPPVEEGTCAEIDAKLAENALNFVYNERNCDGGTSTSGEHCASSLHGDDSMDEWV